MQANTSVPLQHIPPRTQAPPPGTAPLIRPPDVEPQNESLFLTLSDEYKQNIPWQYEGYRGLSKWMASSNDFLVLRRFSKSAARSLLYLQNEIGRREHALEEWDSYAMKLPPGKGGCGSFEEDAFPERVKLIQEMSTLLQQYYSLVNSFAQIKSKPDADDHRLRNVKNWFDTHPQAIDPEEQRLVDDKNEPLAGDLFAVVSHPETPTRWILHKSRILRFWFPSKRNFTHVSSPQLRYHSDTVFDNVVCLFTVFIGLGLLFAPMWWLHYVSNVKDMLGIITGFVALFAFWLWMAAGPRQFEILLGTAAYAAVLYIYLQAANGGDNLNSGATGVNVAGEASGSVLSPGSLIP